MRLVVGIPRGAFNSSIQPFAQQPQPVGCLHALDTAEQQFAGSISPFLTENVNSSSVVSGRPVQHSASGWSDGTMRWSGARRVGTGWISCVPCWRAHASKSAAFGWRSSVQEPTCRLRCVPHRLGMVLFSEQPTFSCQKGYTLVQQRTRAIPRNQLRP